MTRSKEEFAPLKKGRASLYSCGPTVYSRQHVGNLRAAIFPDILKRTLRYAGYVVTDVMNITDVGHLVSDADEGEDKMVVGARKEGCDPYEIAREYEGIYLDDLKKLNIMLPEHLPRATEHITEQIDMIKALEERGFAYVISDGVYFDTGKFAEYGALSGQSSHDKEAGARVEVDSEKRHPADFALWKFLTGDNEYHVMKWESPWGVGFPGWHIECSAMSHKYLGDSFDIHTGGIEHIALHHENEIAQNVCSGMISKVSYWMHNEHLLFEGGKMAKSEGNVVSLDDVIARGVSPLAFRFWILGTHYRSQINFTWDAIDSAKVGYARLCGSVLRIKEQAGAGEAGELARELSDAALAQFEEALYDDLNTSKGLAVVFDLIARIEKEDAVLSGGDYAHLFALLERVDMILGLGFVDLKSVEIPDVVRELASKRLEARKNEAWDEADALRDQIEERGFEIDDTDEGFELHAKR